jgi:hypothetical protein
MATITTSISPAYDLADFLRKRNYVATDNDFGTNSQDMNQDTYQIGILKPTVYNDGIFKEKRKPANSRHLGTIYIKEPPGHDNTGRELFKRDCPEFDTKAGIWIMRVYGRNNMGEMLSLAEGISNKFNRNITLKLADEREKSGDAVYPPKGLDSIPLRY